MYLIASFGVLLVLLSLVMVMDPVRWSRAIVRFSEKAYFHAFEIISRIGVGAGFVVFADQVRFAPFFRAFGYLLMAVGVGLLLAGAARHRQFAVWSARKFQQTFRPAGLAAVGIGAWVVYAALAGST